ncbi:MAG: F0F1 ATP synthase subunit gamma [Prevotellaceae bacterium]|jgi:F-type H+-transporting ATPase subunit gamma|nr:F0F1 ATP synthase subunit gamma [Prevotellaceae bacterium]
MSSLKEVKTRINSVKSTRQITSAMKMVASAKLHRAQGRIENMLPYQQKLGEMLVNFLTGDVTFDTPYTKVRPVKRVAIVPFSSNTSLCGAFNSNMVKLLQQTLDDYRSLGNDNILIYPVGKKIEKAVRKLGFMPQGSFAEMADKPSFAAAEQLAAQLMQLFAGQEVDRIEILYHHFKSMGTQLLTRETYLPLDLAKLKAAAAQPTTQQTFNNDYLVEPSVSEIIAALLPKVLHQKLYTTLSDSNASEHAARTLAMQTATDNANSLIQDLTKQYNKSRQQAITGELLDMESGMA